MVNKKCDSFSYKVVITIFNLQWTKSISFSQKNPENCKTKCIENTYFIGNTYNHCIHEYKVAIIDQTYGAIIYKDEIEQKIQDAQKLSTSYHLRHTLYPENPQSSEWLDKSLFYHKKTADYQQKLAEATERPNNLNEKNSKKIQKVDEKKAEVIIEKQQIDDNLNSNNGSKIKNQYQDNHIESIDNSCNIAEESIEQIKSPIPIFEMRSRPISEMQFTKVETEPSPIQDNPIEPVGHFFSCFNLCEWS